MPVYSLYSETREPTAEMLAGLDVLVIDLQDIGARIYTFVYTMANCLRACGTHGVPVVVCDRPNPIGGVDVEGETLVAGFESFVGLFPIPMRHGLTIGELARLFNERFALGASLEVVTMDGWQRAHYADDCRTAVGDALAQHADARCGHRLSGHGAARRHARLRRPRHDAAVRAGGRAVGRAEAFADRLNGHGLPGVVFRPAVFEPTFQKHHGTTCDGCQLHVTDRAAFRPVVTGVASSRSCAGRIRPPSPGGRRPTSTNTG